MNLGINFSINLIIRMAKVYIELSYKVRFVLSIIISYIYSKILIYNYKKSSKYSMKNRLSIKNELSKI